MISVAAATKLVAGLPEVHAGTSYGNPAWFVHGKAFAWLRPFSKADVRRFGADPVPAGAILALRVADERAKQAALAAGTPGVFTIPHFDGHAAVLVQLDLVPGIALRRLVTDAWLACAPPRLTAGRVRSRVPRR